MYKILIFLLITFFSVFAKGNAISILDRYLVSLNGGITFVIGNESENHKPGLTFQGDFMLRPYTFFSFGIVTSFSAWKYDQIDEKIKDIEISGATRFLLPLNKKEYFPFIQFGTGFHIVNRELSNGDLLNTQIHWGFGSKVGMMLKQVEIATKYSFYYNGGDKEYIPRLSITIGYLK